mmetsp:Transcript_22452/g.52958  ORF Transcript_22452/g.52958 Transcript_22452/m.52958 type:complete len:565 (+) Transcript_22452:225-1919(+)
MDLGKTFLFLLLLGCGFVERVYSDDSDDGAMTYVPLPDTTSPGGKCMDGTQAGYYIRDGSDPTLFVIHLKGGGACISKDDCDGRVNTTLGSSRDWEDTKNGAALQRQLNPDCSENPVFCDATAVHVPYCTSDTHRGTVDEPTELSYGYYFDGHLNFRAIIEMLIVESGLGEADNVLLTGGSAGSVGALFNVDWLSDRLQNAAVKASVYAGWYFPSALDDDLPEPHNPSDYPHFAAGENGNQLYDIVESGEEFPDVWGMIDSLSPDCLEAFGDDKWACSSAHFAYKYIKSSVYIIHTQYDSNQIHSGNLAPHDPADEDEVDTVKRYYQMWGNATRRSLQVVVDDDVLFPKPHPDGVFSASCRTHGTPSNVVIDGFSHEQLVRDWFFQEQQFEDHYKLIEECTPLEGEEDYVIPCNTNPVCAYAPQPSKKDTFKTCAKALFQGGCFESFASSSTCLRCARDIQDELAGAKCTLNIVSRVCKYVEANGIPSNNNDRATRLIEDLDGGYFDDEMDTQLIDGTENAPPNLNHASSYETDNASPILNHASSLLGGCAVLLGCIVTFVLSV